MRHAVILAGGAGTRLWPLSRKERPKQLLPIIGGKSLLQVAMDRLSGLFDPAGTWVITNTEHVQQIRDAMRAIPAGNIVGEPMGQDTANAIALAVELIGAKDKNATMAVFTADHIIRPAEQFNAAVGAACEVAEKFPDALVTFGIKPSWPHTGLGYIEAGAKVSEHGYKVTAFKEKPDHQTARRYVDSGNYYWNSGMFVWTLGAIRRQLKKHLPETLAKLEPVGKAASAGKDVAGILAEVYPTLKKISIDYAVMEKADQVMMVELKAEWLDVGSWPALEDVSELDPAGNCVIAPNAVLVDSFRNIVVCEDDHLIAILGMDDCIVVHSADATLVSSKSDSQQIKQLVEQLEGKFGPRYS